MAEQQNEETIAGAMEDNGYLRGKAWVFSWKTKDRSIGTVFYTTAVRGKEGKRKKGIIVADSRGEDQRFLPVVDEENGLMLDNIRRISFGFQVVPGDESKEQDEVFVPAYQAANMLRRLGLGPAVTELLTNWD